MIFFLYLFIKYHHPSIQTHAYIYIFNVYMLKKIIACVDNNITSSFVYRALLFISNQKIIIKKTTRVNNFHFEKYCV